VQSGETLFTVRQGERKAPFRSPISGIIHAVNSALPQNLAYLETNPYDKGWICSLKPDHLAAELESLKISEKAALWYQKEILRIRELLSPGGVIGHPELPPEIGQLVEGQLAEVDDQTWNKFVETFLGATS